VTLIGDPGETVTDAGDTVTPLDNAAGFTFTVPVNPPWAATLICTGWFEPWLRVKLAGEAESVKLGTGGGDDPLPPPPLLGPFPPLAQPIVTAQNALNAAETIGRYSTDRFMV
jgi:hypothetical protein